MQQTKYKRIFQTIAVVADEEISEAFVYAAMSRPMVTRLARGRELPGGFLHSPGYIEGGRGPGCLYSPKQLRVAILCRPGGRVCPDYVQCLSEVGLWVIAALGSIRLRPTN